MRKTILIVDDEPANLSVLSQLLDHHFRVCACRSGEQALKAVLKEPRPDLVLLDVMMPEMDGYTVLKELKNDPETRDIPVIFVTSLDDELDEQQGLRLGAVDYVTKPVKPAIMLARIKAQLELKEGRDRLKDENVWLEAEVARRTHENTLIQDVSLRVMAGLAETRDTDTGNHIARTQGYLETLARELQSHPDLAAELDEISLARIVKAAPLHDIGKIGIPDGILLKPGELSAEEWDIMKSHPRIGGDAIRRAIDRALAAGDSDASDPRPESLEFLEVARIIAKYHHERWDGTGYPDGLSGKEIPLPARLMALADAYDALTMDRVYKTSIKPDEAARTILEEKGKHFDPDIVDAFQRVRGSFEKIRETLADKRKS
jgi:putative two-component system response regulator